MLFQQRMEDGQRGRLGRSVAPTANTTSVDLATILHQQMADDSAKGRTLWLPTVQAACVEVSRFMT